MKDEGYKRIEKIWEWYKEKMSSFPYSLMLKLLQSGNNSLPESLVGRQARVSFSVPKFSITEKIYPELEAIKC